jgi:tetratricopeptide (TPR) repeat protein
MNTDFDHRALAVRLFNRCWELLDVPESDPRNDELERAAFASLYHWSQIGDAKNIAIGEWMIAHMYFSLNRLAEAERFATKVINYCNASGLEDFYLAYGYLELARIRRARREEYAEALSKAKAVKIFDDEDREHFESDLAKDGWESAAR